ncbi:hypothetical protein PR202_gb13020 [Eleusine coracana subsp. coracana]|uniref:Uncharacterized protein n=1 Tax=Eleusine coracana subsp. coracana TaxID=191504 RepID=A0AAV5ERI1_ELECO|nr:hypothetical protein PR202_gb13020 [Eleusine coracana subsp. coracana]
MATLLLLVHCCYSPTASLILTPSTVVVRGCPHLTQRRRLAQQEVPQSQGPTREPRHPLHVPAAAATATPQAGGEGLGGARQTSTAPVSGAEPVAGGGPSELQRPVTPQQNGHTAE